MQEQGLEHKQGLGLDRKQGLGHRTMELIDNRESCSLKLGMKKSFRYFPLKKYID